MEVTMEHPPDLGDVALGDPLQRGNEMQNSVIGELVIGKFARTPCCDQPSAPQMLEMLRRIGHRQAGALGEDFDAALALGNLLQQFETVGMAKRLGDRTRTPSCKPCWLRCRRRRRTRHGFARSIPEQCRQQPNDGA